MRQLIASATVLGLGAIVACSDLTPPQPGPSLTPGTVAFGKAPKVTICHAAGRAGTTHYIRITISANGLKGHFDNNGTPKAGHEQDFVETPQRPCNAPEGGTLIVCKQPSGAVTTSTTAFAFTTSTGESFSLHLGECSDEFAADAGDLTVTEIGQTPGPSSWFPTGVTVTTDGSPVPVVNQTGFVSVRPLSATDAVAEVNETAGGTTVVTFFNKN